MNVLLALIRPHPDPRRALPVLLATALAGCTAVSISPPLSARTGLARPTDPALVPLSSGELADPHQVIGVVQMTQHGFRWMHEIEVVDDANADSILYQIALYARAHGADGVQHLSLIDLDPQTPADKINKQIDSAVRIQRALDRGQPAQIAMEGTETRWEVQGELVTFTSQEPRR